MSLSLLGLLIVASCIAVQAQTPSCPIPLFCAASSPKSPDTRCTSCRPIDTCSQTPKFTLDQDGAIMIDCNFDAEKCSAQKPPPCLDEYPMPQASIFPIIPTMPPYVAPITMESTTECYEDMTAATSPTAGPGTFKAHKHKRNVHKSNTSMSASRVIRQASTNHQISYPPKNLPECTTAHIVPDKADVLAILSMRLQLNCKLPFCEERNKIPKDVLGDSNLPKICLPYTLVVQLDKQRGIPWCPPYEMDVSKINNGDCLLLPICGTNGEVVKPYLPISDGTAALMEQCEKICAPDKNDGIGCRPIASEDNDVFLVGSTRPWCPDPKDSLLKIPPNNCNQWPRCVNNQIGNTPAGGTNENPYYAGMGDCVLPLDGCTQAEDQTHYCNPATIITTTTPSPTKPTVPTTTEPPATTPSTTPTPTTVAPIKTPKMWVAGAMVGLLCAMVIISGIMCFLCMRRRRIRKGPKTNTRTKGGPGKKKVDLAMKIDQPAAPDDNTMAGQA